MARKRGEARASARGEANRARWPFLRIARGRRPSLRREWPRWREVAGLVRGAPAWRDRVWLGLVVAGLLADLALYAYVWFVLPTLPAFLPLRYNAVGAVNEIGPRAVLFRMPAIGSAVLLANTILGLLLHRHERLAALFLAGSVPAVVALLFLATINIVRLAFGE